MSETTKDTDKKKKPLSLSRPGRLELNKTVEQGQIRQNFSHGRSKAVTVEVRKKRTYAATEGGGMAEVKAGENTAAEIQAKDELERLTSDEKAVRARVLEDATLDAERRKIEDAERAEREAGEAKKRAEEEAKAAAAVPPLPDAEAPAKPARSKAKPVAVPVEDMASEEDARKRVPGRKGAKPEKGRPSLTLRQESDRRRGKLTISKALDDDGNERVRSLASMRRAKERERRAQAAIQGRGETTKVFREVVVPESITIQELANRMAERAPDVMKALMNMGVMATINQSANPTSRKVLAAAMTSPRAWSRVRRW
jgi:translation initiation factor IF-2